MDPSTDSQAPPNDAYATHLAEVDKQNGVLTSEDIRNESGALLVPKGTRLSPEMADRILKHRLIKPLEESVSIKDVVTATVLFDDIIAFISQHDDFQRIHQALSNHDGTLKECAKTLEKYPLIKQKLTVLKMQFVKEYQQACFSAWLSVGILSQRREGSDAQATTNAFITGLVHDLGILHISPDITKHQGKYSPEQWRTMQAHVIIGQLFLDNVPGLPKTIAEATLQHHERNDGTGYPKGLFAEEISGLARTIAITDSVFGMRMGRFAKQGRTLNEIVPLLQFNSSTFCPNDYSALMQLIKQAELSPVRIVADDNMPTFINELMDKYCLLMARYSLVYEALLQLPETTQNSNLRRAHIIGARICKSTQECGVLTLGILRWMEHVQSSQLEFAYTEMEEISIIYEELNWHMQLFYKYTCLYLKTPQASAHPLTTRLEAIIQRFDAITQQREKVIAQIKSSDDDIYDVIARIQQKIKKSATR